MVRQIIWAKSALQDRKEIMAFWNDRNESTSYSRKLNELIKDSIKLICRYPFVGKPTNKENVRVKILKNYLIIYEIAPTEIIVLSVWDSRQNPVKLKMKRSD